MENDTTTINDIVTSHAEQNKDKGTTGEQQQSSQQQQQGSNEAGAEKQPTQSEIDAAAKVEQEKADLEQAETAKSEKIESEVTKKLLQKFNVDSLEELEEKLGNQGGKKLSEEEQKQADAIYEANLQKFAVEKKLMSLDDFGQLKTLQSKQDADLIFEGYLADWKEENPEVKVDSETTEADILKMAKDDFEKEYKLNSTNENIKKKGIAKLAKEAAEIRNPKLESYNEAKQQFNDETEIRANYPKYVKKIDTLAASAIPEKIEWHKTMVGDKEVTVEVELPAEDRKEIIEKVSKRLQSPETYQLFKDGKVDELKERIAEYTDYLVEKKSRSLGNDKLAKIFLGQGTAAGSNIGAENSFATNQTKATAGSKQTKSKTDAEQEVLKQFGKT